MAKQKNIAYAKQELIRLCHTGYDSHTLRSELLKHLRKIVPFDIAYFSTMDPASQLVTNAVIVEEPPSWMMPVFVENEFLQNDFNKFSDMIRTRQTVGVLGEATKHHPYQSPRYLNMMVPMAMEDELRAVFVTEGICWGTLCLHRQQSSTGYTAADADFLAQLAPHVADGLRKALLLTGVPQGITPDGPGVILLAEDLSVIASNTSADQWLAALAEMEKAPDHTLPLCVRSVVAILKAIESNKATHSLPKLRLQMRQGHWLTIYASRLNSLDHKGHITVIFDVAKPTEIAPLIMQAYLLTKREGEVTQCVLRGWSTAEIAARLHITPNTVQDHLKAIFEKVNVDSRGELAAHIYLQQNRLQ